MVHGLVMNAPVQWWDAAHVAVLCPYFKQTHHHGFGDGPIVYEGMHRISHCNSGTHRNLSYTLVFPLDVDRNEARYEINKIDGRFESAKFPATQRSDAAPAEALRPQRPQFADGSKRMQTIRNYCGEPVSFEVCDVAFAVSACVCGKVPQVKTYLDNFRGTNDYEIFLCGEDARGNTALCCAAMEANPEMVKLLLQSDSTDVNAQNHEGRTPLMEAALWARLENVELLLDNSADKTLRDHAGKLAFDLAQSSEENEAERHHRVPDYKEAAYEARQDRKHIAMRLGELQTQDQLFDMGALSTQGPRYDVVRGKGIALVTPISDLGDAADSEDGWTYVALLDRGSGFPQVSASSRDVGGVQETLVAGLSLAPLVNNIASVVGYYQGPRSQCHADHAEKQLVASFVDKHVFLPDDTVDDNELNDYLEWVGWNGPPDEDRLNAEEKRPYSLAQLKRAPPPSARHRRATIVSTATACVDCEEFCRLVNKHFDLELSLQYGNADDARTLSIASLGTLCQAMDEATSLCQRILARLEGYLGDDVIGVQSSALASDVVENPQVVSVAALFDSRLKQFGGSKHILMRLAATRSAVEAFQDLHVALDRIGGGAKSTTGGWMREWENDVAVMKKQLADQLADQSRSELIRAFPNVNAKNEALILLSYEMETYKDEYSDDELELLRKMSKHMYDKVVAPETNWFIPSHDVQVTTERVGIGSYGEVFVGEWRKTKVVVKYVDVQHDIRTFLREVQIWGDCRHEFVVNFFGACHVSSSRPFIVCEYATNGTLRVYLGVQRTAGRSLAWRKLYDVARGLYFFHTKTFVHRDLKGDNILVTKDGTAKLADFGLSFVQSGSREIVEKWGAIQWRSPECVFGEDVGYASDVYSLGMCR